MDAEKNGQRLPASAAGVRRAQAGLCWRGPAQLKGAFTAMCLQRGLVGTAITELTSRRWLRLAADSSKLLLLVTFQMRCMVDWPP